MSSFVDKSAMDDQFMPSFYYCEETDAKDKDRSHDLGDSDDEDEEDDSDEGESSLLDTREKQQAKARKSRQQKTKEIRRTRFIRHQLATVLQLSKDASSYLSLLPHEMITAVLNLCDFPENDVRLMTSGFDKVGIRVRLFLPDCRGSFVRGRVSGYDGNHDKHSVKLVSGEVVQVQMDGIGRNRYRAVYDTCHVQLIKVPSQPREVTIEWLRKIFSKQNLAVKKLRTVEVTFSRLEGTTCLACAAEANCKSKSGRSRQINCFVKLGLISDDGRGISVKKMWESGCYEREVYFYSKLSKEIPLKISPECHYSHCEAESLQSVLVLEDLTVSYTKGNIAGLTPVQLRQALHSLAILHSSFWSNRALQTSFDTAQGKMKHITSMPLLALSSGLEAALPHLLAALPSAELDFHFLLENVRFLYFRFAKRPVTLIHADVFPSHLFFPEATDSPAVIVDWQRCQPGISIRDVATVLATGCVDQPKAIHRSLIKFYVRKLEVACDFDVVDVFDDYRLYLLLHMLELAVFLDIVGSRQRQRQKALRKQLKLVADVVVAVRSFRFFRSAVVSDSSFTKVRYVIPVPTCRHGLDAVRTLLASGENKGRCFFGCPLFDVGKECGYFRWIESRNKGQETGAPVCIAHGKVAAIRFSLKLATLGKAFYCCSLQNKDQCDLFKWLEDGEGSSLKEPDEIAKSGKICHNWSKTGRCRFGDDCCYLHTKANLPSDGPSRPTEALPERKCGFWARRRICPYGKRCHLAHSHL
eukprot:m.199159 g.199159  ORF g.199159 m.199159 type:complete len:755 (+) comp39566_c0_seq4:74-2338(+)